MGNPNGFLELERIDAAALDIRERIKNYNEFHTPLFKEEQQLQASRCMDCGVPFCQSGMNIGGSISGCPLGNLIPEFNDLLYRGYWEAAYKRLRATNSFPEFTSRVCPALCEKACTCSVGGDAVTVRANEFAIVENAYSHGYAKATPPEVRTGKRIAVIGSGPAGLAAADQLNRRGHSVTVFEKSDRIGGLLMYGIPNMKLEKHIIERRIQIMQQEGIEFKTGVNVGADIKADELLKSFDRVIIACGAGKPRDISAKGRDAKGIYFAVDFLKAVTKTLLDSKPCEGFVDTKGKNVIVIGGGDTGNDCVGTCVRQGAKSVIQLEMMPKLPDTRQPDNPWPEWPRVAKTDYGQEEAALIYGGDIRRYQTTVKEFISGKGNELKAVKLIELEAQRDEKTGRLKMTEKAGTESEVKADIVLICAGFLGVDDHIAKAFGTALDRRSNIASVNGTHLTSKERVFVCGDSRTGQSLVVRAIREGRDCAREVDESLMGYSNL
ncbi:MAG: glutamate synthase subunit beta [Ruminococcus sp.]|nr:glutamate synthase subunit beta [Ruminococcus sp.]